MSRLVREIAVARDADRAWAVVGDLSRYDAFLVGITRWEPAGPDRYWVLMQVGSVASGGEVEVAVDPVARQVTWQSRRGTHHAATITVHEDAPGRSRIGLEVGFRLAGPLGPLVTRASRSLVARNLVASLESARHLIEHGSDDHRGGAARHVAGSASDEDGGGA